MIHKVKSPSTSLSEQLDSRPRLALYDLTTRDRSGTSHIKRQILQTKYTDKSFLTALWSIIILKHTEMCKRDRNSCTWPCSIIIKNICPRQHCNSTFKDMCIIVNRIWSEYILCVWCADIMRPLSLIENHPSNQSRISMFMESHTTNWEGPCASHRSHVYFCAHVVCKTLESGVLSARFVWPLGSCWICRAGKRNPCKILGEAEKAWTYEFNPEGKTCTA